MAEFVYITDDTYTKKQVLRMEHLVLKVLSFDLAAPTIIQFLTQYFLHQSVSKQVENLTMVSLAPKFLIIKLAHSVQWVRSIKSVFVFPQYLGELSLVDSDPFLKYLPSQTAAAAYIVANNTVTGGSWVGLR